MVYIIKRFAYDIDWKAYLILLQHAWAMQSVVFFSLRHLQIINRHDDTER